ncbi:hypothetical protein PH586_23430, partial [Pseudomonas sp. SA3-5]
QHSVGTWVNNASAATLKAMLEVREPPTWSVYGASNINCHPELSVYRALSTCVRQEAFRRVVPFISLGHPEKLGQPGR